MGEMWKQLLGFLGKEGIGDLMKTGVSLYSANQAGNKLDFQNELLIEEQRKGDILF